MAALSITDLPVNVDSAYEDDETDSSVKSHQQHHDTLHEATTRVEVVSSGASSRQFALTDAGKVVEFTSATAVTATVPANATVAFPVGTVIEVAQYGAGTVTIAAAGGVTLRSRGSVFTIAGQYGSVGLRKRGTNEWVVVGDLG